MRRAGWILLMAAMAGADFGKLSGAAWAEEPLKGEDCVVFVGDDLTQQMFYSRAAATAMLALQPTANLRFFNGGRDGSTAGDAMEWCSDLYQLTKPTVVILAFGLADATVGHDADRFQLDLANLIAATRRYDGVRQVFVLSPPALPKQTGPLLQEFTTAAQNMALAEGAKFIDIYYPMRSLYDTGEDTLLADQGLRKELSLGDRMPSELMHVVIASQVLAGMGVGKEQIEAVAWSPLPPVEMGKIRSRLAWPDTNTPSQKQAAASRRLYIALVRPDELFFRLWRLPPSEKEQSTALQHELAEVWAAVTQTAGQFSGGGGP